MSRAKRASLLIFLLTSIGCLGCDQLTKEIARARLGGRAPISLAFGTVELALTENPGAFMSVGATWPEGVRSALFLVVVPAILGILCVMLLCQPGLSISDGIALALVVGGGAGNWLDRLLRDGSVTDFVRLGIGTVHTGIFNVADVAVIFGVAVLATSHWRSSEPSPT